MMMNGLKRAALQFRVAARPMMVRPVLARPFSAMQTQPMHKHRAEDFVHSDFHQYFNQFKPEQFEWILAGHEYVMFQVTYCPHCAKARDTLEALGHRTYIVNVDNTENVDDVKLEMWKKTGLKTFPKIYYNGQLIGGNSDLNALVESGDFK